MHRMSSDPHACRVCCCPLVGRAGQLGGFLTVKGAASVCKATTEVINAGIESYLDGTFKQCHMSTPTTYVHAHATVVYHYTRGGPGFVCGAIVYLDRSSCPISVSNKASACYN